MSEEFLYTKNVCHCSIYFTINQNVFFSLFLITHLKYMPHFKLDNRMLSSEIFSEIYLGSLKTIKCTYFCTFQIPTYCHIWNKILNWFDVMLQICRYPYIKLNTSNYKNSSIFTVSVFYKYMGSMHNKQENFIWT